VREDSSLGRTKRPTLATNRTAPRRSHSLHGFNGAGNKRGLHLVDRIVNRHAGSFVEDLDAEDLAGRHGAVFVGTREGDIEGQDLVGIPGSGQLIQSTDFLQGEIVDPARDAMALVRNGTEYILMMILLSNRLTWLLRWRYYLHEYE